MNDQRPIRTPRPVTARAGRAGLNGPITADPGDDPMQFDPPPARTPVEDLPPIADTERPAAVQRPAPKFTIHALIDDFPFEVEFSGSADQLRATVARLREIGAVPPTMAARRAVEEEKARESPVCPYHGPMKESTKAPGTYFCTKKMGDGSYCKERG